MEPDQAASRPCLLQRSSVSLTTTIASYSLGSQTFPWLQIDQWWITLRCEALFTLNIRVCVFLCSLLSNANVKYEHHYRPQRSWGKVIFSQASVILFTGRGLPQCMLGYHTSPRDQAPPHRPGTPRHRACWEILSTRGRYASYWNAILLFVATEPFLKFDAKANVDVKCEQTRL